MTNFKNSAEVLFECSQSYCRNLVDEWLETYRIAVGITSPQVKQMMLTKDWKRALPSAKSLPPHAQDDNADDLATTPVPEITAEEVQLRVPSAPSGEQLLPFILS